MFDNAATSSPGGAARRAAPPGWPRAVPPPTAPGWQASATSWLLDHCPADYRGHETWRRHPVLLAWLATRHLDGQLVAMRQAYRDLRVDMADLLDADVIRTALTDLEAEGLRLRAARRGAGLVLDALQGKRYIPRL